MVHNSMLQGWPHKGKSTYLNGDRGVHGSKHLPVGQNWSVLREKTLPSLQVKATTGKGCSRLAVAGKDVRDQGVIGVQSQARAVAKKASKSGGRQRLQQACSGKQRRRAQAMAGRGCSRLAVAGNDIKDQEHDRRTFAKEKVVTKKAMAGKGGGRFAAAMQATDIKTKIRVTKCAPSHVCARISI